MSRRTASMRSRTDSENSPARRKRPRESADPAKSIALEEFVEVLVTHYNAPDWPITFDMASVREYRPKMQPPPPPLPPQAATASADGEGVDDDGKTDDGGVGGGAADDDNSSTSSNSSSGSNSNGGTFVASQSLATADTSEAWLHSYRATLVAAEGANILLRFPREMLTYFLSTYPKVLNIGDFKETNTIVRKSPTNIIENGNILAEYVKGVDNFVSNLNRCLEADLRAIQLIVRTGITLPQYGQICESTTDYEAAKCAGNSETSQMAGYCSVPVNAQCRTAILEITNRYLMAHDGCMVSPTNCTTDREITMSSMSQLRDNEMMLVHAIMGPRITILDLLATNVVEVLPDRYMDRLQLIARRMPKLRLAINPEGGGSSTETLQDSASVAAHQRHVTATTNGGSGTQPTALELYTGPAYYLKPVSGFGSYYSYQRVCSIAAGIGMHDKTIMLAFLDDSCTSLIKHARVTVPAWLATRALTAPRQQSYDVTAPTIKMLDRVVPVHKVPEGAVMFEQCLHIEFKDSNANNIKVGACMSNPHNHPISRLSDIQAVRPETLPYLDALERALTAAPAQINELTTLFGRFAAHFTVENKAKITSILMPTCMQYDD